MLVLIFGILGIVPYFVPHGGYQNFDNALRNDFIRILSAFAIILGLVSLMKVHHDKIKRQRENWQYSYVLIIGFVVAVKEQEDLVRCWQGRVGEERRIKGVIVVIEHEPGEFQT